MGKTKIPRSRAKATIREISEARIKALEISALDILEILDALLEKGFQAETIRDKKSEIGDCVLKIKDPKILKGKRYGTEELNAVCWKIGGVRKFCEKAEEELKNRKIRYKISGEMKILNHSGTVFKEKFFLNKIFEATNPQRAREEAISYLENLVVTSFGADKTISGIDNLIVRLYKKPIPRKKKAKK